MRRIAKRVTAVASAQTPDERADAALLLRTDLQLFSAHIERLGIAAQDTSEREKAEYRDEMSRIEHECEQDRAQIAALNEELAAAQHTQENRLEYDNIAHKILVYPSRDELERCVYANRTIAAQEQHIAALEADTSALEEATADTVASLAGIGTQMRSLHTSVKERLAGGMESATAAQGGEVHGDGAQAEGDAADAGAAPPLDPTAAAFEPRSRTRRGRRTD